MSLLNIMNIGKTALFANQAALNVTGHNISNVNTPGYTRQEVILEIATPGANSAGYLGRGVTVGGVKRSYARFIEGQLLGQEQSLGKSTAMNEVLSQVEQVFNDSSGLGLSKSLLAFFDSWESLSSDADDTARRTMLLSNAESLVSTAKRMEADLLEATGEINHEIAGIADRVNTIARKISALNGEIAKIEGGETDAKANDLRDTRGSLLTELGKLVELRTLEDRDGSVTVMVGMRNLVAGTRVNEMTTASDGWGNLGVSIEGIDVTSRIDKGRLSGLIDSRTAIERGPLLQLRKLAAALAIEINAIHSAGYGLDGVSMRDFFSAPTLSTSGSSAGASVTSAAITDMGALTLSEYDIAIGAAGAYSVTNRETGAIVRTGTFSSGTAIAFDGVSVTLTGTVAAGDSFFVSPLTGAVSNMAVTLAGTPQIAAASSATALPGDNTNALRLAALAGAGISRLGNATFSGFYAGIVSSVGSMAADASDLRTFDANLQAELAGQRDSASGVNLDEEATNLIVYQRGFEAAARLISVADELIQTVLAL